MALCSRLWGEATWTGGPLLAVSLGEEPGASVSSSTKQCSHYRPAVRSEQVNTYKALTEARGLQQRQGKPLSSSLSVRECELSINSILRHSGKQSGPGPHPAEHGAPQTPCQGLSLCRPLRSTRLGRPHGGCRAGSCQRLKV